MPLRPDFKDIRKIENNAPLLTKFLENGIISTKTDMLFMLTFIRLIFILNKVIIFLDISEVLIINMVNISNPHNINKPHEQNSLESAVLIMNVKAS